MKRSPLIRRTRLKRQRTTQKPRPSDVECAIFTEPSGGYCDCGCGRFAIWRDNHHVIPQQLIKREGRQDLLWDIRNRMRLHRFCHERHTNCSHKLSISVVPDAALVFAVEFFGDDQRAADWFCRHYGPELEL